MKSDTPPLRVEVAIIGAGSAGMSAYRAARAHTESVVVIESGPYGTTCARVGCMPSKLLIAAAEAARAVREADQFGVRSSPPVIDGTAVMARVRSERDRFVGFVEATVDAWPLHHRLRGHARFLRPGVLQVGTQEVHADRFVIATGSRPVVPDAWRQALGDRLVVNDDVFEWHTLPGSVAVVGTGVIGLELAQALSALGVRVRLFGRRGRIGPLTDPALQAVAREHVAATLSLSPQAQIEAVSRSEAGVVVRFQENGQHHEETFDLLLAATGRETRLAGLDLARAGIALDAQGLPAFDRSTQQIHGHPVFIAGDVHEQTPLLHEASDDGRIAGDNAGRWPEVRPRPRRAPLMVVFSHPQMMMTGATHADLLASSQAFVTGAVDFGDQGRARVMGVNAGALHVYAAAEDGRFLGAEMVGPAAEHIGHLLAWSLQRGATVQQMLDSPFYHPVIEEGLRTALRDARQQLRLPAPPPEACLDCDTASA